MRALCDMDTIQIEITNDCINSCSNCTRFCGHQEPYHMNFDYFKQAVDSMVGYPKMTGIMGGEPLLHPEFEQFCKYIVSKIPKKQLGLWTCLPSGFEHYREIICETFDHIFINDHTRNDIYHCPVLVASEEVIPDTNKLFNEVDKCWLQNSWSGSINPKGAFFCEIAASMSLLFDGNPGWEINKDWWYKTPKDYKEQIEEYCPKCGCALSLPRRSSIDGKDDISPKNLERLKGKSFKIDSGRYVVSDLKLQDSLEEMASYKDFYYRKNIANRYGIFLVLNDLGFLTPYLNTSNMSDTVSLFDKYKERYGV